LHIAFPLGEGHFVVVITSRRCKKKFPIQASKACGGSILITYCPLLRCLWRASTDWLVSAF